ncbi:MAG: MetQ/NlpA family ABC transporter substrate-binding protein [Treponema sp.]|nr:MetQ/NlpA family ABC transporter substrate-binding protein [Treponema sp.]
MKKSRKLVFCAAIASFLLFVSCGGKKSTTVKIGVCGSSNDQWKAVQYVLNQEKAGITLELVEFSAYNLPNEALNSGDVQLNAFQHKAFLQSDASKNGYDLTVIGDTLIAPLTLYSKKYSNLDEIKASNDALKFAIPSDGTNLSRGIKLLESAGLIEVDPAVGYTPELKDITKYLYNVEVVPQAANTLPQTLDDYAGATINGTYAMPVGFVPSRDGLIIEKQSGAGDNPYVNIIVARTQDKDNEVYTKIVKAFQTQIVAEYLLGKYKEAFFPAFDYAPVSAEKAAATVAIVDAEIHW